MKQTKKQYYDQHTENLINRIISASKNNTLTFFVGAGISKISNAPTWQELIEKFYDTLETEQKSEFGSDEFLIIPQKYYYSIGKDDTTYYNFISSCLNIDTLQTNEVHKLMCYLRPHSFVTTNFDDLIEKSTIENCLSYKSVACDSDVATINGDKFILKLHGDLNHRNIVLKEEDYLNYSDIFKLIETMLKAIFSTNTVVFIGYGLNDYNIKLSLNWAKHLLADSFNKPIFIYTDDNELNDNNILYQESRGLEILDFRSFLCADDYKGVNYLERYCCVLKRIINYRQNALIYNDKYEAFDIIYQLLKPLNNFTALKTTDVGEQLKEMVSVSESGIIYELRPDTPVMEYFAELCKMNDYDVPQNIKEKYVTIRDVLKKALIRGIKRNDNFFELDNNVTFSDPNCITFNYNSIKKFTTRHPKSVYDRYIKAFYLTRLCQYREALDIYTEVAITSFKNKNYLLYYLAQINRCNVYQVMKNLNRYYGSFEFEEIETLQLNFDKSEPIFENLPIDFKQEYSIFSNLYSDKYLYKNVYEVFSGIEKLKHTIDTLSIEIGETAVNKVFYRINNNLHFILGNGLYLDAFNEFRSTIKSSMDTVIAKFAQSIKERLISHPFAEFNNDDIKFDEVDIYCFIEYCESSDISKIMKKYSIKDLPIYNIDVVNNSIYNLFSYYDKYVANSSKSDLLDLNYQNKIKNCITLLRYLTISPALIEYICKVLFKYEFYDITIMDKILFVNSQILANKLNKRSIRRIMHTTLIKYIDDNISALEKHGKYNGYVNNGENAYWTLANFIFIDEDKFTSKTLSDKIEYIIDHKLDINCVSMFRCYNIIYKKMKEKLCFYAKEKLRSKFDFKLFSELLFKSKKMEDDIIVSLKKHLITIAKNENSLKGVVVTRANSIEDEFAEIGYWCFKGYLRSEDFKEFIGMYDKFDFFYNPVAFDYKKFKISWIMDLYESTYISLSENNHIRRNIHNCICSTLIDKEIETTHKEKLTNILLKYFINII